MESKTTELTRCSWAKTEREIAYHDFEWGKPLHDDRRLFELLILEGMQAGLSWRTILDKREHMRNVFDGFDPRVIAGYEDSKKQALLQDAGIIRNRAKISALVSNAIVFLEVQKEYGSFDSYLWSFVDNTTIVNAWTDMAQVPSTSEISDRMSKDFKKKGFRFVGSTICYAYMQSAGLVNDHMTWCEQYNP